MHNDVFYCGFVRLCVRRRTGGDRYTFNLGDVDTESEEGFPSPVGEALTNAGEGDVLSLDGEMFSVLCVCLLLCL